MINCAGLVNPALQEKTKFINTRANYLRFRSGLCGVTFRADPDVFLNRNGDYLGESRSPDNDQEIFAIGTLEAGTYALAFQD